MVKRANESQTPYRGRQREAGVQAERSRVGSDHADLKRAVIAARGLTKAYGDKLAVNNLSIEVASGKVTGFLGPNGAGKTTTLRMILGLAQPTSGTATIMDHRFKDLPQPSSHVGALIETAEFHPGRSARNHLRMLADAARVPARRVEFVLGIVGLGQAANKRVRTFSLGMKQRLGLAGALLGDPEVLVLDEPANGLDPEGIRWLRDFLRSFSRDGKTVLVSSHILAEVAQMADEVIVINHGRLVIHAPMNELTSAGTRVVRVRSSDPERFSRALSDAGMDPLVSSHGELTVTGATPEEVGTLAAQMGVAVYALAAPEQSLEDIFLELTSNEEQR